MFASYNDRFSLKQTSHTWFQRFYQVIVCYGFKRVDADYSLFIYRQSGHVILILVYVDDIVITGDSEDAVHQIKMVFHKEFSMKDLDLLKYFLGIEIDRGDNFITTTQSKYAKDILRKANMLDCKPVNTPMSFNGELYRLDNMCLVDKPEQYCMFVGALQ